MRFLGTGAADMLPDPFCDCPLCRDAREHPEHVRLRSHFLLDPHTLIDFGPDLGASCARDRVDLTDLRQVFGPTPIRTISASPTRGSCRCPGPGQRPWTSTSAKGP